MHYDSERSEPGGIGWSTDYPFGEINLLIRLSEMTGSVSAATLRATSTTGSSGSPTILHRPLEVLLRGDRETRALAPQRRVGDGGRNEDQGHDAQQPAR